jgi:hypothetical protein
MAKKSSDYDLEHLKKYAKAGAEAALHKLREEVAIIEATFPELATPKGRSKVAAKAGASAKEWGEASKEAVSARVKKYMAERKKAKK